MSKYLCNLHVSNSSTKADWFIPGAESASLPSCNTSLCVTKLPLS